MNFNKKILVLAMAGALPFMSAHAQSADDLKKEIELLKAQLKMLSEKVEAMSAKPAGVDPQEFNRLVQKMDLVEEEADKAGLKGMTFKGVMEVAFSADQNSAQNGFDKAKGNGGYGSAMLEVSKAPDEGLGWTLRLMPLSSTGSIVHEATVSIPMGGGSTKLNAGLTPDYSGYEYSWGNQNPLISNNLLYSNTAASNYTGVGMSYEIGDWTAKWMIGQVDGGASRKAPGFAYRADYSMSEYSGLGFSGVHIRTSDSTVSDPADARAGFPVTGILGVPNADLFEIDAYHTRGDLTLQGQFSLGRVIGGALNPAAAGADARWWGLSGLVGYKLTPRLQALARFDYINNRANGGGVYYNSESTDALGVTSTEYGPEFDTASGASDPSRGANRYALTTGLNYAINANTQWKTELRFDRSSGYNFVDSVGERKKGNTTFGTSLVMSF